MPPVIIRHTERPTYLNHIEDALIGFKDKDTSEEDRFKTKSHGEIRFLEYIVDKVKESADQLNDKIGNLRRYEISILLKGERRNIFGIKNVIKSALVAQGIAPQLKTNPSNGTIEITTSASEECLIGILERYQRNNKQTLLNYNIQRNK